MTDMTEKLTITICWGIVLGVLANILIHQAGTMLKIADSVSH